MAKYVLFNTTYAALSQSLICAMSEFTNDVNPHQNEGVIK